MVGFLIRAGGLVIDRSRQWMLPGRRLRGQELPCARGVPNRPRRHTMIGRERGAFAAKSRERRRLAGKRAFDVAIASVSVVLFSPILVLIALAILVADGRPILYRQTRVGRQGRPFEMLKFRTMVTDAHDQLDRLRTNNEREGPLF